VLERGTNNNILNYLTYERKTWSNKFFSVDWVIALSELSSGLHHMSQMGILHRDL
jgi:hypothetical protein